MNSASPHKTIVICGTILAVYKKPKLLTKLKMRIKAKIVHALAFILLSIFTGLLACTKYIQIPP